MTESQKHLEKLLLNSTIDPFNETERAELNLLLRNDVEARAFATMHLTIDALLAESLAANEQVAISIHTRRSRSNSNWLARAAAWVGSFYLLANTAKAATAGTSTTTGTSVLTKSVIIIMKKAFTSITTTIIVLGGLGIYSIHSHNQSTEARVAEMQSEIQSLSDQLGIKSTSSSIRMTGNGNVPKNISITQVIAVLLKRSLSMQDKLFLSHFREQLATMDSDSLETMLLDAEKISNPIDETLALMVMHELISKDPAEATRLATQLIERGSGFQFQMSVAAARAFEAWLLKDPVEADAWYLTMAAEGKFNPRCIPPNGLEHLAIDRSFARLRFAARVMANPEEAVAMLSSMRRDDVTIALAGITDPNAMNQILPMLEPEQRISSVEGVIKSMAEKDLAAAFTWTRSLGISDLQSDTLMAKGVVAALASGKLDLNEVSQWSKNLNLSEETRSDMQIKAALITSRVSGNEDLTDWDKVADLTAWIRKEAPASLADGMVGDYLGQLIWSKNGSEVFKAFEEEVARQQNPDPSLTIRFAWNVAAISPKHYGDKALKYLEELPSSPEREEAIDFIKMNR